MSQTQKCSENQIYYRGPNRTLIQNQVWHENSLKIENLLKFESDKIESKSGIEFDSKKSPKIESEFYFFKLEFE